MEQYLGILKGSELDLMREVEAHRMADLDEDALLDLHRRVRRARNKHTKNYRRRAAARVAETGGRGLARPAGRKAAHRAEAFEEALSLVSNRLAVLAHEAAEALKRERLALAREGRGTGPESGGPTTDGVGAGRARAHEQTTGSIKKNASSQAAGARRQAERDAR